MSANINVEWDLQAIENAFKSFNTEAFLKAYQYQGFDADRIKKLLASRHQQKLPANAFVVDSDGRQIPVGGEENFTTLVNYLVNLFNKRGNNIQRISKEMKPLARAHFNQLVGALSLESHVANPKKCNSGDILTLARIAAAFPCSAVSLAAHGEGSYPMVDLSDIGITQQDKAGKALAHQMAASVLTVGMKKSGFPFATFLAAIRRQEIIGAKQKQTVEKQWTFHRAALQSMATSESNKETLWNTLGECSSTCVEQAKEKLLEMEVSSDLMLEIGEYCSDASVLVSAEEPECSGSSSHDT